MKKLFTFALVLLVATAGYSQVRQQRASKKDAVSATKYVTRGMESFENVQSQPNMTRSEGELDYSTYDWQSNDGARTWTIVWPDGKVNFAYTIAGDASFSDRGTGIGTYDYNNDLWTPLGGRIENEKTGFGSIARYKENGIVIAAHTASQCGVYIVEDKDNMEVGGAQTMTKLENSNEPTWPVVMTSGADRDIIHVVATGYNDNMMYYFRSTDGGESWDKENVILPYMSANDGIDWNSNCCYFMETTEDNCLALVVNNAWSDGMVIYSYDDGETWERKVFYHHPGPFTTFDSDAGEWFFYPRWTSAQWGTNGALCLAYEFNATTGEPGSGSYYPSLGGVAFWSDDMPYNSDVLPTYGFDPTNPNPPTIGSKSFIMDSAYLFSDIYASWPFFADANHPDGMLPEYIGYLCPLDNEGQPEDPYLAEEFNLVASDARQLHGSYNSGICAFPVLAMVPGSNGYDMVAVWSAMDENNMDGTNYYYKLFAAYSADGGKTWQRQIQLTTDFMYELSECVYPQAVVMGTTLVIAVQMDAGTGTYVQGDATDTDASDNYYQGLTFELADLFPDVNIGVPEVSHNTHMTLYPNPATDQLSVILSQNDEIVIYNIMGQKVMSMEGRAGANTISISSLNSGIYFVSAGSDTQKLIVK